MLHEPANERKILGHLPIGGAHLHLLLGAALVGTAWEIGRRLGSSTWWGWSAAALAGALGLALLVRAESLERPRRLRLRARRSLAFPSQWTVRFDKRIVGCGTVAMAVIRSDGVRFVVDIGPHAGVSWGTPNDGSGRPRLIAPDGRRLRPDPVPALVKAAQGASAVPVLWLPEAAAVKNLRDPQTDLIIVMGSATDLRHAMQGAEIAPIGPRPPRGRPRREPARLPSGGSSHSAQQADVSGSTVN